MRGKGVRIKVRGSSKLPSSKARFTDFLQDSENTEELFDLLTEKISLLIYPPGKEVYVTKGESAVSIRSQEPMGLCNHEVADSRKCIHVQDALREGAKSILVSTVATDVIVILIGILYNLKQEYPHMDV